eukprot:TRINITY_DN13603_c0_g3_i3.p3 TRINITY_DN13603_c0_g3~~TRINITY_DN13603_c0_g3_i3.p3  ORF type:complete len:238 (+),score=81.60 TRINITY_DN13603_c0_g3_i3:59-715(+)
MAEPKRKRIRVVDGVSEEDALRRRLPDITRPGLDLLIVGYNPGVASAARGHHFAGDTNLLWRCLRAAGLVPEDFTWRDDGRCLQHGVGFTNIVGRTTRGSDGIGAAEYEDGARVLLAKLKELRPKVVCFVGVGVWREFACRVYSRPKSHKVEAGPQPPLPGCGDMVPFVMPSTSRRAAAVSAEEKEQIAVALRAVVDSFPSAHTRPAVVRGREHGAAV